MRRRGWSALFLPVCLVAMAARGAEQAPLELEAKIALGKVRGRIDHLAIDLDRRRLFVAELGNDSVGVVDLGRAQLTRTIVGLREPQGLGYEQSTDTLFVANAGDGSVRLFQGAELTPAGHIDLGEDADNIRIDPTRHRVVVGYGNGALAFIDPSTRTKTGVAVLDGHPESFQLDAARSRVYANIPDAQHVAVVDGDATATSARWRVREAAGNFPMTIDQEAKRLLVVTRYPARLIAFDLRDGTLMARTESCGDADDVFVDGKRGRIYVSCGDGFLDIFNGKDGGYVRVGHVTTVSGARTSLWVPELDRLFLAVRARSGAAAGIWVFRPAA